MSWGVSPWVYPVWDSLGFLDLVIISFPILGKFQIVISSSIFSWSFFLSSSSGTPIIRMFEHFILPWRSLRLSSFVLIHFSFFLSDSFISTILSSVSLILSSASKSSYSTICHLQSVSDLIYYIIHYILTLFYFF